MILTTTESIPGSKGYEILGLAMGNTIRAKHIGKDIVAGLRNIVGGELKEYTEALGEARKEAMERMVKDAKSMGADAVVNMRFTTSAVVAGGAELLAYGTAVKVKR